MEVMAKYSYDATADEELSFRVGDCLKILETSGNWYKAELNGVDGFVPKNFLNIQFPSWYQEDASRSDAKKLLMSQPTGTFLIRRSQDEDVGSFSISVRNETDVQHLKVIRDSRGQYFLWTEKFPSLNQLVEFYKKNSIFKQNVVFLQETQQQQERRSDHLPSPPPPTPPQPSGENPRRPPLPPQPQERRSAHLPSAPPLTPPQPSGENPRRPPPPPRPVVAIYNFQAKEKDELEFCAGDIIAVMDSSDPVWWKGQLRGQTGLFPCNYTKPM